MTIAEQITRIKNAKAAIKQSIENKGVTVSDTAKLDEYPALIDSITVGSGDSGESYEQPGFYNIRTIGGTSYKGLFAYTYFDIDLLGYESSNVTDMTYMFCGCGGSTTRVTNLNSLDFSSVKNIGYMFYNCYIGGDIDFSGASFPEATNAVRMFASIYYIDTIDMSNTSFPKLTNASYMFATGASSSLPTLNLTGINMPNIINASNMFEYCSKITTLDISGINFSNATSVDAIFANCKLLVEIIGEMDLSRASNGLYSSSYNNPFKACSALETVWIKNIYKDVATMTDNAKWSIDLSPTKIKDECLIYIINELPNLADKGVTSNTKIKLTLPTSNTLTDEQKQIATDKSWIVVN